jgi:hypothetical protein
VRAVRRKERNSGRRVARQPAMIPSPGSMVDQMAIDCASAVGEMLEVYLPLDQYASLPKNVRPPVASFGMNLNLIMEAIPPLTHVSITLLEIVQH